MNKKFQLRQVSIPVIALLIVALFSMGALAAPPKHSGKYDTVTSLTPEKAAELSSDAWIAEQKAVEEKILKKFKSGNYTMEKPLVVLNPYGAAPLSALVLFETPEEVSVDIVVKGKTENVDIKHNFNEKATEHIIPVYGLYPDYENTVVINASNGKSSEIKIKTEPLSPENADLTAEITVPGDSRMYPGITFVTSPLVMGEEARVKDAIGFDANGDIRSVLSRTSWCFVAMDNGRILASSAEHERDLYFYAGIVEVDPMGKIHKEYLRNGVHHGYRKLLNGNYIVIADMVGRDTVEDHIVELCGKTGEVVRSWDLREAWDMKEYVSSPSYKYNTTDWLHINSIWLVPGEDAILVSARHQDAIFKLDLTNNEIVWVLTEDYEQYTDEFREKLLKPVGDDFEYTWGQHNIKMMENGRILVFDNGNGRSKDPDKMLDTKDPNNYSRVVIYEVDEANMTVKQIWQYGKERGMELFSPFICGMDAYGTNHFVMTFGGTVPATIIEYRDGEVIWEMKVNRHVYQTERMNFYDMGEGYYELGVNPGEQFGQLYTWKEGKTN